MPAEPGPGAKALRAPRWLPAEQAVIDRYARGIVSGRHPDAARAARLCKVELDARSPGRRTFGAIHSRLCARSRELGRANSGVRWLPAEREIALRRVRRYEAMRRKYPRCFVLDAARDLVVDLYEQGFDRTLDSCVMEIWKHRRSRFGRPRP
ncbi:hypothetical protein FJY71_02275 [candidate division WOR-3 bacterium]|nr:hypothetical protein [candidate division WOR-3 bacterium]